jgi:acetyl-CoA carboxylase carboxyltransferase component
MPPLEKGYRMTILNTAVYQFSSSSMDNRRAMQERLAELADALTQARQGGGERFVTRHHARGRLLPRERIELLVDQDSAFLELSTVAAWGTDFPVGASVVTGIGVVEHVECVIIASDPTVRDGEINTYTMAKTYRAAEIAVANRLPLVSLIESRGADLSPQPGDQIGLALPDGQIGQLSTASIPTVSVVFGDGTSDGAFPPGRCDYTIMVRNQAKLPLAGLPQVGMATGEITDNESPGRAATRATRSGLADFLAEDERDAVRLARQCVRRLNWRTQAPPARTARPAEPRYDPEDLLALASGDRRVPFDPREVLARVLDGSEFDEFRPAYGGALITGWGEVHGYPAAVLAATGEAPHSADTQKVVQFVELANAAGTPLVFLQNAAGHLVGTAAEQSAVIAHSAQVVGALGGSRVPLITVTIGATYLIGGYGMGGRTHNSRFLFNWPNAMGVPAAEPSAERPPTALHLSGRLYDDGVIDPRDTRTVLGLCLSATQSADLGTSRAMDKETATDKGLS